MLCPICGNTLQFIEGGMILGTDAFQAAACKLCGAKFEICREAGGETGLRPLDAFPPVKMESFAVNRSCKNPSCEKHKTHVYMTFSTKGGAARTAAVLNSELIVCDLCRDVYYYSYEEPNFSIGPITKAFKSFAERVLLFVEMHRFQYGELKWSLRHKEEVDAYTFYLISPEFYYCEKEHNLDYGDIAQIWFEMEHSGISVELGTNRYKLSTLRSLNDDFLCIGDFEFYADEIYPETVHVYSLENEEDLMDLLFAAAELDKKQS